jgi:hypothetical protein
MQVIIQNARLSYPHIFAAKAMNQGDTPKFSASFILNKKTNAATIKEIQKAIDALTADKFKGKKLPADKVCLRDGDLKDDEAYAGAFYVSASNLKRPQVVDRDKSPLVAEDDKPYGGCYVNGVIRIWAQDNQYGKRINASLEAVQFLKDGDRFGAPPVNLDDLPDVEGVDDNL